MSPVENSPEHKVNIIRFSLKRAIYVHNGTITHLKIVRHMNSYPSHVRPNFMEILFVVSAIFQGLSLTEVSPGRKLNI